MILKQVIRYDNDLVLEATWVDDETNDNVKCQAYSKGQMELLRQDIGDSITDDVELLIQEVENDEA